MRVLIKKEKTKKRRKVQTTLFRVPIKKLQIHTRTGSDRSLEQQRVAIAIRVDRKRDSKLSSN